MASQANLDHKGNFRQHRFAELVVEILQAKLSGSLRIEQATRKSVIYFRNGAVVYAVSNARELRLFSVLLTRKKVDQKTLGRIPTFANDLELAAALQDQKVLTKAEIDQCVSNQIESIIVDALTWPAGDWVFSPLARLREDLIYTIDVFKLLIDYARCIASQDIYERFRSVQEVLYLDPNPVTTAVLQAHEKYTLDCFREGPLTIETLRPLCSLPETAMLQSLYVLWLGGLLIRRDWNAAFSATKISEILSARVSLVKRATNISKPEPKPVESAAEDIAKLPDINISLEDYLNRIENAETLYDVLGVESDAGLAEIKHAYFGMAKLFHPDRYHRETGTQLRRIQVAFTQIAQAYETLKSAESRENYDFKVRKELEQREKRRAEGVPDATTPEARQSEQGLENFEKAMEALNEEEFAAAAGHLSRAVHYSPQNALYHAYFGFALSKLEKQHHKAEAALQAAVKLDPKNPKIRMMLVEFFVEMKMDKRAAGELKRFLELVPGNKEALRMRDKMQIAV